MSRRDVIDDVSGDVGGGVAGGTPSSSSTSLLRLRWNSHLESLQELFESLLEQVGPPSSIPPSSPPPPHHRSFPPFSAPLSHPFSLKKTKDAVT